MLQPQVNQIQKDQISKYNELYDKHIGNAYQIERGKSEIISSASVNETRVFHFHHSFLMMYWCFKWNNQAKERNKRDTNRKERTQINPVCRWYESLQNFRESSEVSENW